jgi:hypothetical protein
MVRERLSQRLDPGFTVWSWPSLVHTASDVLVADGD